MSSSAGCSARPCVTQLMNPPPVVRWNCDKHYLRDLAAPGLPVVASEFVEPDTDPQARCKASSPPRLRRAGGEAGHGCRLARYAPPRARCARQILGHMRPLLAAGRAVLLQPYLPERGPRRGDRAGVHRGRFSHAFRKGPLLPLGAGSTGRAVRRRAHHRPRAFVRDELDVARRDPGSGSLPEPPVRARRPHPRDARRPRLLELELTEPSLYFEHGAGSAARPGALPRWPARRPLRRRAAGRGKICDVSTQNSA